MWSAGFFPYFYFQRNLYANCAYSQAWHFIFESLKEVLTQEQVLCLVYSTAVWHFLKENSEGSPGALEQAWNPQEIPQINFRENFRLFSVSFRKIIFIITIDRKKFFHVRMVKPWQRLSREAAAALSLEAFKTRLDKAWINLGWWRVVSLPMAGGLELGWSWRSLPTQTILWCHDKRGAVKCALHFPMLVAQTGILNWDFLKGRCEAEESFSLWAHSMLLFLF